MFAFMTDLLLTGNHQPTCFSLKRRFFSFSTFLSCLQFFMQYKVVCGFVVFLTFANYPLPLEMILPLFVMEFGYCKILLKIDMFICITRHLFVLHIYLFSVCIHAFQHLSMNSYDTFWEWFPSLCSWGTGSLYFLKLCFLFKFSGFSPVSLSQTLRNALHSQLQAYPIFHSYMSSGEQTQGLKLVQNMLLSTNVYHGSSVGFLKSVQLGFFSVFWYRESSYLISDLLLPFQFDWMHFVSFANLAAQMRTPQVI